MKNMRQIIDSFLADNRLLAGELRARQNLARLKLALPADMRTGVVHIFYRAPKLLFGFNHPSHVYNFNHYKKKDIMYCLKHYASEFAPFIESIGAQSMEKFLARTEIIAYLPKSAMQARLTQIPMTAKNQTQDTQIALTPNAPSRFIERALGSFANHATDPKLHAQFERLRTIISNPTESTDSASQ